VGTHHAQDNLAMTCGRLPVTAIFAFFAFVAFTAKADGRRPKGVRQDRKDQICESLNVTCSGDETRADTCPTSEETPALNVDELEKARACFCCVSTSTTVEKELLRQERCLNEAIECPAIGSAQYVEMRYMKCKSTDFISSLFLDEKELEKRAQCYCCEDRLLQFSRLDSDEIQLVKDGYCDLLVSCEPQDISTNQTFCDSSKGKFKVLGSGIDSSSVDDSMLPSPSGRNLKRRPRRRKRITSAQLHECFCCFPPIEAEAEIRFLEDELNENEESGESRD